jgi:hypothetical protein
VKSGATAPDDAVDDVAVNVNLDVNFAHTLIKSIPVMMVNQRGQTHYVLSDGPRQGDTLNFANYVEQLCNLPY